MNERGRRLATALLVGVAAGCGGPERPPPRPTLPVFSAQGGYPLVSAEILEREQTRNPARATAIGEHAHDRELAAVFPADLDRARRDAHALLTRLSDVHRPVLARPADHSGATRYQKVMINQSFDPRLSGLRCRGCRTRSAMA